MPAFEVEITHFIYPGKEAYFRKKKSIPAPARFFLKTNNKTQASDWLALEDNRNIVVSPDVCPFNCAGREIKHGLVLKEVLVRDIPAGARIKDIRGGK